MILCCSDQTGRAKCPMDPFFIVPDKCKCVDFQVSVGGDDYEQLNSTKYGHRFI